MGDLHLPVSHLVRGRRGLFHSCYGILRVQGGRKLHRTRLDACTERGEVQDRVYVSSERTVELLVELLF